MIIMKEIRIALEDHEYASAKHKKGSRTWKQFLLSLSDTENLALEKKYGHYIKEIMIKTDCSREEVIEGIKKDLAYSREQHEQQQVEELLK